MKLALIAFLVLFSYSTRLFAQTNILTGIVRDAKTAAPLAFCSVIPDPREGGTETDLNGHFTLALPASATSINITISSVGYENRWFTFSSSDYVANRLHIVVDLTEATPTLEEVVVTGSNRATTIRENPLAIALVSSDQINKTSESNLIESLSRHVPGLSTVTTGPNISKPFIRGLGYNRVLTLYDGVRQEGQQWGDEHGIEVDNYNIDRVEVIKGPASLMYGSDAVAGVVSLFPSTPKEHSGKLHGQVISEFQSNNGLFGTGLRLNSGNKNTFWSMSGSMRKAGNYFNRTDGYVYNTMFEEKNLSGMIGIRSSHGESRFNATLYDDLQGIPDGSRDSLTRRFTYQIAEGSADDIKRRPIVSNDLLSSYRISPLHQHIQHYRIYSSHRYNLAHGDVDLQLGVQQNRRQEFTHPTNPEQAGLSVRLNTVNYSIRYNAPAFSGIELTGGLNGMLQQNKNLNATDFPVPDYRLLDAGVFGSFQWRKKNWITSGGARYDNRTIAGENFYTGTDVATGFVRQADETDYDAQLHFSSLRQQFSGTSLSLGTARQLSETWSLKFNIARGYRAPNIAEIASNGLDPGAHIVYIGNRNFTPEFSFQQDIGIRFDRPDVAVAASVFNNNISHYIYLNQLVDARGNPVELVQGNKTFRYEQSAAHLFGSELMIELHPQQIKGFTLTNNASVTFGNRTETAFKGSGIQGEYLPFIPPFHLFSSARQEFAFRRSASSRGEGHKAGPSMRSFVLGIDMDLAAAQNRYLALYRTETRTPGYALVNLSLGVDIQYATEAVAHIQLRASNVFDEIWQSNLSRLKYFEYYKSSPDGRSGMYGMGRNFCVKIIVPF